MARDNDEIVKDILMVVEDIEYLEDGKDEEYEEIVCRELREMGFGEMTCAELVSMKMKNDMMIR